MKDMEFTKNINGTDYKFCNFGCHFGQCYELNGENLIFFKDDEFDLWAVHDNVFQICQNLDDVYEIVETFREIWWTGGDD